MQSNRLARIAPSVVAFVTDLDALLRGRFTTPASLTRGRIDLPIKTLVVGSLVLGAVYGLFMGLFGLTRPDDGSFLQLIATTLKVPLLFLLTLAVCLPSLYVLSALAGSRLRFSQTVRLLLVCVAVNLAMLASLAPVLGFFTLCTQSYPFMVLLNVAFLGASGLLGMSFLRRALHHVFPAESDPEDAPASPPEPKAEDDGTPEAAPDERDEPGGLLPAPDPLSTLAAPPTFPDLQGTTKDPVPMTKDPAPIESPAPPRRSLARGSEHPIASRVFRCWLVVYGVVGAQMGWVLRPFIGSPGMPFEWFRERESNFLVGLLRALGQLLS